MGAGLDPCGALQTTVELPADTQIDIVFALGDAASEADAQALVKRYRGGDIDSVLADVGAQWNGLLDTVQVKTPDRAMDVMLNHWLPYQVLVSRVWARTAYYQASGAYGFRDQLQDVMALCVSRPDLAREHLLRAAAASSPRATYNIGGCRPVVRVFAPRSATTACGCLCRHALRRRHRRRGRAGRAAAVPQGRCHSRRRQRRVLPAVAVG